VCRHHQIVVVVYSFNRLWETGEVEDLKRTWALITNGVKQRAVDVVVSMSHRSAAIRPGEEEHFKSLSWILNVDDMRA
jgi:hypothetical protein